jgi:hypothetical protein
MTIDELNQIESDLKKVEAAFPRDYGTVTALELAAEVRRLMAILLQPVDGQSQARVAAG